MGRKPTSHKLVKECIYTALMLLMEKQDYEKITITDISRRAGVSRMAYYRVYQSKDDIIKTHMADVFDQIIDQAKKQEFSTEEEFFICFFSTVQQNTPLFINALKANLLEFMWRKMKEYGIALFTAFYQPTADAVFLNYRVCFFTGGFLHITREWLETGMKESVETMAQISCCIAEAVKEGHSKVNFVTNYPQM